MSKVLKSFNIDADTLMLLKQLQKEQSVNISAFTNKVLKKCAKEALGLNNKLIQEGGE